ncbi:glycerophosphoryl diester phosphodiesterase [Brevifollis gellanilyticus]|uniref:glycerophosphodiester phosphodiesterase n=2 Tax=Brevifollis gellanilyticus TaxID=748831 RepID=A0A512MDL5_9BACT|nr:glycerophosphoryl diester phosphodiesterase [Brevifollis gellanilyticus]
MAQETSPLIIAHRGASGYLPEHTLEAKAMAHAQGAHYLEQDLVLTKDDIPVVLHDIYIDTVTDVAEKFPARHRDNGRYYALDFTLAELKTLNATERFDVKTGKQVYPNRFPKGQGTFRIPTLEEELQLIQGLNRSTGREAGIYPEIKEPLWHQKEGHDISRIVLPILHKYGYKTKSDRCFVQCFELEEVERLRGELGWQGRLIYLTSKALTPETLAQVAKVADGIGPDIKLVIAPDRSLTPLVKDAHALGLKVHPYTLRVDALPKFATSADDLLTLLLGKAGVDGLFSDFPDVALNWPAR